MEVNLKKKEYKFRITEKDIHQRLDIFLAENLNGISRSLMQKYITEDETPIILVNSSRKKPNYRLQLNDIIEVNIPEPRETALEPADIRLDILFEDDDIIVLNKQPGVPVHPSLGHQNDTIVNALMNYLGKNSALSTIGGEKRPGIVHRLDKDTSGVLIIAKNDSAHLSLSRQFSQRSTEKIYEAIVKGTISQREGVINKPITRSTRNRKKYTTGEYGRESITYFKVIDSKNQSSWIQFIPKTGRTHQIRVHAQSIGHPIFGDPLYARKSHSTEYIALIAKSITFQHPQTGHKMTFSASYPGHFKELAQSLGYKLPG